MPEIFPEKINLGDEQYPDLAAIVLNKAVKLIKEKSKKTKDNDTKIKQPLN